jgi:hypothetical protein
MIYRSNLEVPDLTPYFRLDSRPRPWSFGHDVPSHPEIEPECGYFTHDEAAILYNVALQIGGTWVDIGSRFGWTSAHLMAAGCSVIGVDPCYALDACNEAMREGIDKIRAKMIGNTPQFMPYPFDSSTFFLNESSVHKYVEGRSYSGFVIDGDHSTPFPLLDAIGANKRAKPSCAVLFHDFRGKPIRDGVRYLMDCGWKCRVYWTPNGVAVCWRGFDQDRSRAAEGFMIPSHRQAENISSVSMDDFDFTRCV